MKNLTYENEFTKDYFTIELSLFKRIIFRNKYLFGTFILVFSILGLTYSLTKKPFYQGQFEIVVDIKNKADSNQQNSLLRNLNLGSNASSLATEVGILESPLVLRPVYQYVMSEKRKINPEFNEINFITWKDNYLKIELKQQTSILQINYKDHNKKLIKPVLDQMSEAYQLYSGRTKKRNLELTKAYLNSQISEFRLKSNKSLQRVQEYAIDNNLSNELITSSRFEKSRKSIKDQIKNIDLQIEKLTNIGESYNDLQYVGFLTPSKEHKSLMQKLTSIEQELYILQSNYKPSDISIALKKKEKELTTNLLKEKTIGYLETEKFILQTKLESISRPKEVILTFKQILRDAERQEKLLAKLEDQLQITNLEAAKLEDPWELITEPYVDSDVITNKNIFILFGFFAGAILGLIASILKEKISGIVFDGEVLEEVFNCRIIEKVNLKNNESIEVLNLFLKNVLDSFKNESVKFFIVGEENSSLSDLIKYFDSNKNNISVEKKLSKILDVDKLLILSSLEGVKEKQIRYFAEKFKLMNVEVVGIIFADSF